MTYESGRYTTDGGIYEFPVPEHTFHAPEINWAKWPWRSIRCLPLLKKLTAKEAVLYIITEIVAATVAVAALVAAFPAALGDQVNWEK